MKRLLPLALALTLILTGCGLSSTGAPTPVETNGPESVFPSIPAETASAAETVAPMPTPGSPNVYTDYSKLEDRGAAPPRPTLYERWHGEFIDHLIPSPDYGPLIPFSGPAIADPWDGSGYCLEGLMTLEGKVVVDPVYASITRLGWGGFFDFGIMDGYHPAYLLSRYVGEGSKGDMNVLFGAYDDVRSRLCAADGSWVTGEYRFGYTPLTYGYVPEEGGLFALRDENVLVLLDMDTGVETFAVTLDGLEEEELDSVPSCASYSDGRVTLNTPIHDQNYAVTGRSLHGTFSILTLEGETLFEDLSDRFQLYGGRCLTSGSDNGSRWVELRDVEGKLLFSRQWASPFD